MVFIAATGLEVDGVTSTRDPKLAKLVFDALEREHHPVVCVGIAMQAAAVHTAEVGLEAQGLALPKTHPTPECRRTLAGNFLTANPQYYDAVVELARTEPNPLVRERAVYGLSRVSRDPQRQTTNCEVWAEVMDDTDNEYASAAAWQLGSQGPRALSIPCTAQWPALLNKVEARAAAGRVNHVNWVSGVCDLLEPGKRISEEQKKQSLAVLRSVAQTPKNSETPRASALDCLGRFDPGAKELAESLQNDPSEKVKTSAARIVARAKPPH